MLNVRMSTQGHVCVSMTCADVYVCEHAIVCLNLVCVAPATQGKCGEDKTLRVLMTLTAPVAPPLELTSGPSQCKVSGTQEVLHGCQNSYPVSPASDPSMGHTCLPHLFPAQAKTRGQWEPALKDTANLSKEYIAT